MTNRLGGFSGPLRRTAHRHHGKTASRCSLAGFFLLLPLLAAQTTAADVETGKALFLTRCSACHTIGGGALIGPDLAGVTSRRDGEWLRRQIKEPDRLLAENDPIAVQLLRESNNVPMVPLGLNDGEVAATIDFLRSTEQQASVETGLPPLYLPTIVISLALLAGLTLLGLRVGTKGVEVR